MTLCPLCSSDSADDLSIVQGRRYLRCPECQLIFMHPDDYLSREEERAHYGLHQNSPDDPRYRNFLSQVVDPLLPLLPAGAQGLDYGAGPGPTLSVMMAERGFPMNIYDPFFAPDPAVLERRYDFVTCTETVEHFHQPAIEFQRLRGLVGPRGLIAVMTQPVVSDEAFPNWWYVRDPTHVCFYSDQTMQWIARWLGMSVRRVSDAVWVFQ